MEQTQNRPNKVSKTRGPSETEVEPGAAAAHGQAQASASTSSQVVNMRKSRASIGVFDRSGRRFSDTKDPATGSSSGGNSMSGEVSNLVRIHGSTLGQSAPSLSNSMKELCISRRSSRVNQRKSFISTTSPTLPRCLSPMSGSPLESPRMSPNQHFAYAPIRRVNQEKKNKRSLCEGRRWSVASLPSSGYGTTPGSSSVSDSRSRFDQFIRQKERRMRSSQCSSQERLHQLPNLPTKEELQMLTRHFSNETHHSCVLDDCSPRSPLSRPRSRSLSSPSRSPVMDTDIVVMNTMYKERFPKATQQMEERLKAFINETKVTEGDCDLHLKDLPILRFVLHQIVEMARDCLQKSEEKLISSRYFYDMSENLERLHSETKEKSIEASARVGTVVRRLLLIISRPARLLECLEFDPEEFYHMLEEAEGQAKLAHQGIKADIPQYILSKLGMTKNSSAELDADLSSINISPPSPPPVSSSANAATATTTEKGRGILHRGNKKEFKNPSEEDFEVIKLISNGAYGAVYLVRVKETRQRVAMKKISKNNLMLRNQVDQVFTERDIMSFTDNPFVVSMYCSFETKKHLCLVMEYVEGGDCAALLKTIGPLPSDMARFYFAETVLAVEYLHSYGIVHRDLKPDNLLITALGHIKLTDFGLSKMGLMSLTTNLYEGYLDRETRQFSDKQVTGTPEYIAPEVILRQGYGKPVDWWSMGIILYEFLIGCVPFFGETPEELFAHTVNDDIEWPDEKDWPVQLESKDLITQLLQHNPLMRLGTGGAQEVKDHPYFCGLDWTSLLRQKAEFVPQLDDEEDTSYFDTRMDRYKHDMGEDTDDTDESMLFGSFSSISPRFHKVHSTEERRVPQSTVSPASMFRETTPPSASRGVHLHSTLSDSPKTIKSSSSLVSNISPLAHDSGNSESSSSNVGSSMELDESKELSESRVEPTNLNHHHSLSTPESSQTESDDVSPQVQRKRRLHTRDSLPRFSISIEDEKHMISVPLLKGPDGSAFVPMEERSPKSSVRAGPSLPSTSATNNESSPVSSIKARGRPVIKSASASGLSLMIPSSLYLADDSPQSMPSPGGSSTASSRDTSPCRELSPLVTSLKPPIIIKRGARGFGFTVNTIRVYYGDTNYYTMHHLVMAVDEGSPAFEAGLSPGDLITHINGEPVQGLFHTQVLHLLLSGGDHVTLRSTPLENTSIKAGGHRREPGQSKLARRSLNRQRRQKRDLIDKRRKPSLFKRISNKRASVDLAQPLSISSPGAGAGAAAAAAAGPSVGAGAGAGASSRPQPWPLAPLAVQDASALAGAGRVKPLRSPSANRVSFPPAEPLTPQAYSPNTSSSSSGSSAASSPAGPGAGAGAGAACSSGSTTPVQHYQRPSTLHGLKHKLHSAAKSIHSPSGRRKSVGHIPLSPLARTPSPSPLPSSPTRSPSPLAFPAVHQPGSSNTTQSYSPGSSLSTPGACSKKGFARPKSAEPGSPLLRRALSPDRLHPRSAENKSKSGHGAASMSISPLCNNPAPKVSVAACSSSAAGTTVTSRSPLSKAASLDKGLKTKPPEHPHPLAMRQDSGDDMSGIRSLPKEEVEQAQAQEGGNGNGGGGGGGHMSVKGIIPIDGRNPLPLPRIAEEKDSPPGSREEVLRELVPSLPPPPPPTTPCTPSTPFIPFIPHLKSVIKEEEPHKKKEGCDKKSREAERSYGASSSKAKDKP
ncbi:Microtubule-associated serine/threonine-protein kinase 2 [Frankliniella fusca]|uniref:non-specific serine/threonine protein kinase n=1 Tax=Frankliniella fusca TaxID=407009 RepID=A0AAE1H033_9NEOP|nr:Microtubule-associated serine/threonine-protein kinase 2 [Frankliniella fusca]